MTFPVIVWILNVFLVGELVCFSASTPWFNFYVQVHDPCMCVCFRNTNTQELYFSLLEMNSVSASRTLACEVSNFSSCINCVGIR